jgi:hypothetical protein
MGGTGTGWSVDGGRKGLYNVGRELGGGETMDLQDALDDVGGGRQGLRRGCGVWAGGEGLQSALHKAHIQAENGRTRWWSSSSMVEPKVTGVRHADGGR